MEKFYVVGSYSVGVYIPIAGSTDKKTAEKFAERKRNNEHRSHKKGPGTDFTVDCIRILKKR